MPETRRLPARVARAGAGAGLGPVRRGRCSDGRFRNAAGFGPVAGKGATTAKNAAAAASDSQLRRLSRRAFNKEIAVADTGPRRAGPPAC